MYNFNNFISEMKAQNFIFCAMGERATNTSGGNAPTNMADKNSIFVIHRPYCMWIYCILQYVFTPKGISAQHRHAIFHGRYSYAI